MMKHEPSKKTGPIEDFLEKMAGRTTAIKSNRCIPEPIGCGRIIDPENWDTLTVKEYTISGLCQQCQNRVFK